MGTEKQVKENNKVKLRTTRNRLLIKNADNTLINQTKKNTPLPLLYPFCRISKPSRLTIKRVSTARHKPPQKA